MNKLLISAITKKGFEEKLSRGEVSQYLVAFIQETKEIWALGIYYPCPYTKKEILDFIKTLMDEDNKIYGVIDTKEEQLTNLISLEFVRAIAKERSLEQLINKNYTDLQESKVNKDSTIPIKAVSFIGNLDGLYIDKLTDYIKATTVDSIKTTDSLNIALGKLEHKTDIIYNDLFGGDNDKIINKWEEIVDFISSVEEGKDITDEFITRKTDLVITGNKTFEGIGAGLVTINRTSGAIPWVCFKNNNNIVGYLGVSSESIPTFNDTIASHNLLHAGNYSNYALPLSGGTITGLLQINRNPSAIQFKVNDISLGYLGVSGNDPVFWNAAGNTSYKIYHEGNDGEGSGLDADLLGGIQSSQYVKDIGWISNTDLNSLKNCFTCIDGGTSSINAPDTHGNVVSFKKMQEDGYGGLQLFGRGSVLYYRNYWDHKWGDWKTIAFTDSDITGNAATATQLKINEFELNDDLNDFINDGVYVSTRTNVVGSLLNTPNTVVKGEARLDVKTFGSSRHLKQTLALKGQWNQEIFYRFKFAEEWSNWKQIATTDSNVASATKLQTPVKLWGNDFDGSSGANGKIQMWSNDGLHDSWFDIIDGYLCISASKINANYTGINLCPYGGNVGIGINNPIHKLDVNGNIGVSFEKGVFFKNKENTQQWSIKSSYSSNENLLFVRNEPATYNALTITESGKIGIGTNIPNTKLHVAEGNVLILQKSSPVLCKLQREDCAISLQIDTYKGLYDHNSSKWLVCSNDAGNETYIWGKKLIIRSGENYTNGIILNPSGNVTIGSSDRNSGYKLDIDGTTCIRGGLEISNTTPYIDFHYDNQGSADYTSRIIETEAGTLSCSGKFITGGDLESGGHVKANGHVYIPNNYGVCMSSTNGTYFKEVTLTTSNDLVLGLDSATYGGNTYIDGNTLCFRYGTTHTNGIILNPEGNVTIGETNLASTDYKLYVDGLLHANSLSIQSDTKVDNLNADKLDGYEAEDFALKSDLEGINTILESIIND